MKMDAEDCHLARDHEYEHPVTGDIFHCMQGSPSAQLLVNQRSPITAAACHPECPAMLAMQQSTASPMLAMECIHPHKVQGPRRQASRAQRLMLPMEHSCMRIPVGTAQPGGVHVFPLVHDAPIRPPILPQSLSPPSMAKTGPASQNGKSHSHILFPAVGYCYLWLLV